MNKVISQSVCIGVYILYPVTPAGNNAYIEFDNF